MVGKTKRHFVHPTSLNFQDLPGFQNLEGLYRRFPRASVLAFYAARAAGALRPTRRARNCSCGAERSHEKTVASLVPAFYAARAAGAPRPVTRRARNCSCGVERSHEKKLLLDFHFFFLRTMGYVTQCKFAFVFLNLLKLRRIFMATCNSIVGLFERSSTVLNGYSCFLFNNIAIEGI